jgi:putative flippase GtrA
VTRLAGLYAVFAVIATLANLGMQRLVLVFVAGGAGLLLAMAAGTGVGLVVKYTLDKLWIFEDPDWRAGAVTRQFGLYALMGVATTLIFWITETGFWLIWQTHGARELGAVIGLTVGYVVKYRLDRAWVFRGS